MPNDAVTGWTLAELSRRIAAKDVSCAEVAEVYLARIDATEPRLNAFITVLHDRARAAAKSADAELAAGRSRGPLHGIPVAVKDLFWTKGVRTTSGSAVEGDFVPDADATAVARLQEAGAYVVGKTNMVEFAYGGFEHNDLYGPPRNPWNTGHTTGGSSSGSAAAVATGAAPLALGTDTAGSVRAPASLCGLVGLKPTYGLVSRFGVTPLAWSQDHVGPLARIVEDVAIAMNVLAGHDIKDPTSANRPAQDYVAALTGDVRGLRVGVPREYVWDVVHPEVERAVRAAIATLGELGAIVEEVSVPELEYVGQTQIVTTLTEATAYHGERVLSRAADYHPSIRRRLETGLFVPAAAYAHAQRVRRLVARRLAAVFRRFDVLALPTSPTPAPRFGQQSVPAGDGREISLREAGVRLTRLFNPVGVPAISVPCGFSGDPSGASGQALPIGLQIAGPLFADGTVMRAAHAYQQATDWHTRRPPNT